MNILRKPVTLYVEHIEANPTPILDPSLPHHMDIEMTKDQAKQLLDILQRRIKENLDGSIRIRFTGMVQH